MKRLFYLAVFLFSIISSAQTSLPIDYNQYGFYRVAAVAPKVSIGNPEVNGEEIFDQILEMVKQNAAVVLLPELALTGYTAEDLFHSEALLERTKNALVKLVNRTRFSRSVVIVGAPYRMYDGRLYNMAFVINNGHIIGAIPKIHLPNYNEFYEKRWFESGEGLDEVVTDKALGTFRISPNQLFKIKDMVFAVEICEDLWAPISPSSRHALKGANVIFNLSGSNELVGKSEYRRSLIANTSSRLNAAYVYASSGPTESTKDIVFGGHIIVAENGSIVKEGERFKFEGESVVTDLDVQKLLHERMKNKTFGSQRESTPYAIHDLSNNTETRLPHLSRDYSTLPFVPSNPAELDIRSSEIITIQATALARRLMTTGSKTIILGVSGGLDSTLALLVATEAAKILNWKPEQIVGVTMPGFGTTQTTKTSAIELMTALQTTQLEIPITKAVEQHFSDINHDPSQKDSTYENAQARERTQILFDVANQRKGIVLGTGDLSELCLGWCTFNADHMASYNVNGSVPKTLVKFLVDWFAKNRAQPKLATTLQNILNTEISPELLPPDASGKIQQKTESAVGPYDLNDFITYHFLRNGFSPEKIYRLAQIAFKKIYDDITLHKWIKNYFTRFSKNQFKRTTLPAGPKVGSVSVSPRGDLRFPDEVTVEAMLANFDTVLPACNLYFK